MSTELPENNAVSSALQFKKRREARDKGEVIHLSSGLSILARRPEITKLIAKGLMPSTIVQRFMELERKGTSNLSAADLESILMYQREIAKNALIQPVVKDDPDYANGEIHLDDLDEEELSEITQYVNGGAEALAQFRKERESGVSTGLVSETVSESQTQ